ncbi:hypothetical protein GCM10028825_05990 [Spirosoma agri]
MAAALTPKLEVFDDQYTSTRLASLFNIPFTKVRDLNYDQAMYMLAAESVKSAYLKRVQSLRSKSKK